MQHGENGDGALIGADHVIDYTQEVSPKTVSNMTLILAANGFQPLSAYERAVSPQGVYVMSGGATAQMFQAMLLGPLKSKKGGKKMGNLLVKPFQTDLLFLKELLETGKVVPVIDRRYPLSEVPDAIRYLEAGHAKGKVVISLPLPADRYRWLNIQLFRRKENHMNKKFISSLTLIMMLLTGCVTPAQIPQAFPTDVVGEVQATMDDLTAGETPAQDPRPFRRMSLQKYKRRWTN